jgi:hypothetical protein
MIRFIQFSAARAGAAQNHILLHVLGIPRTKSVSCASRHVSNCPVRSADSADPPANVHSSTTLSALCRIAGAPRKNSKSPRSGLRAEVALRDDCLLKPRRIRVSPPLNTGYDHAK